MPTLIVQVDTTDSQMLEVQARAGQGQLGESSVMLSGAKLTSPNAMSGIPLGAGQDLRGKVLVVTTTVVDLRREHDRLSAAVDVVDIRSNTTCLSVSHQPVAPDANGGASFVTVVRFSS